MYVGAQMDEMNWSCDVDLISHMQITKLVKSLGYMSIKCLWYQHPKYAFPRGLRPLNNDDDVVKFVEDVKSDESPIKEPVEAEKLQGEGEHVQTEPVRAEAVQTELDQPESEPAQTEPDQPDSKPIQTEPNKPESELLYEGDDWDWISEIPTEIFVNVVSDENSSERYANPIGNPEPSSATDFDKNDVNYDDLDTPPGSEVDAEDVRKFPKFNQPENGDELVKNSIKDLAMETKKNLYFKKNDGNRIIVRGEPGCPFYMRISKRTSNEYWQLVSFTDDHTCHRRAKHRQAKTKWLANNFVPVLRQTPEMKSNGLIVEALDKWGVKLSTYQAYRAKVRAIEMI
uniref:Uncharacterized protein LOC105852195 n=1 Tax=Cicer arietinum TaxID=3827 RepID=A0A1S3E869_CICAR|nr:uncharacterized protein LOC105852195 [Cicer arietinum]